MSATSMTPKAITWKEKAKLARHAAARAIEARLQIGAEMDHPLCIYSACEQLGAPVRFVDIDMEGMYRRIPSPRIFISVHRPLVRRNFTCAHELGHHLFGHGTTLDETKEREADYSDKDPNEFVADTFAAHFLMPVLGIRAAFARRNTDPSIASPLQVLAISTEFGVGYDSLLTHLAFSLKDISAERRKELLSARRRLAEAFVLDGETRPIAVLDAAFKAPTLDIEINHLVVTPLGAEVDSDILRHIRDVPAGRIFLAQARGSAEVSVSSSRWCSMVRITSKNYIGMARYRFLSDPE